MFLNSTPATRTFEYNGTTFAYVARVRPRMRSIRATVHGDGRVVVSHPRRVSLRMVEDFVRQHASWVAVQVKRAHEHPQQERPHLRGTRREYLAKKEAARALVNERLSFFNQHYGFTYARIAIKNMSTRWGSCSAKKNLNFHYRIVELSPELVDYLVVHELCHVKELNHAAGFWQLVSEMIPVYEERRSELRNYIR